jgi:pimeloyl-ACP methyl ester carboxylesterase
VAAGVERTWITVPAAALQRGRGDVDVFALRYGQPGPRRLVCVHGLGGSHVNWMLLAPLLADLGEVWALDCAGFGYTAPSGRSASLEDNLDLVNGFVSTVAGDADDVVVLGNSLGGLISLRLAARRRDLVRAVVAIAPASPRPAGAAVDRDVLRNFALMAVPGVGERWLARRTRMLTPEEQVGQTLRLCTANPSLLDPDLVAEHVEIARRRRSMPYAHAAYLTAARTMLWQLGPGAGALWEELRRITAPVLVLSGAKDRLIGERVIDGLTARHPNWTAVRYPDLGHIPMIEDPVRVADEIRRWLTSQIATAQAAT